MNVRVEFSNDGTVDSLTHAPAPAIFLENLQREFARSRREATEISIMSVQWVADSDITEPQLTALARRISEVIRGDEFFARISESGFWIFFRGNQNNGEVLLERIFSYKNDVAIKKDRWRTSIIICPPSISLDEWIALCDRAHFTQ
jgi:GGDEF domain-containing protein